MKNLTRLTVLIVLVAAVVVLLIIVLSGGDDSALSQLNRAGAQGKSAIKDGAKAIGDGARAVGDKLTVYQEVGQVDWESGVIRATGTGAMPAEADSYAQAQLVAQDAAEMDAHAKIIATLAGLKLRAEKVSDRHAVEKYDIEETVKAKLVGSQVVDVRQKPDGTVEVDVEVKIHPGRVADSPAEGGAVAE